MSQDFPDDAGPSASDSFPDGWLADGLDRFEQPGPRDSRFGRLMDAIAGSDSPAAAYNCVDLGPMLEAYASDLRQGLDVPAQYEPLREHLRTCSQCRLELEALTASDAPMALGAPDPPSPLISLPFLPDANGPWSVRPRAQLLSPGRGLLIRFAPGFLAQRYVSGSALAVRGAAEPAGDLLLMAAQAEAGGCQWLVQVQSTRPAAPSGRLTLCIDLDAEPAERLRVALAWGEQRFVQDADAAGHVCFADLPAAVVFQSSPSLTIDVQVIEPPDVS